MNVFSPIALYMTYISWKQYGLVFSALYEMGFVYLGFLMLAFSFAKDSLFLPSDNQSTIEANRFKFLWSVLSAYLVVIVFEVPTMPLQVKELKFQAQCVADKSKFATIGNSGTTYDDVLADTTSESVKIPYGFNIYQ